MPKLKKKLQSHVFIVRSCSVVKKIKVDYSILPTWKSMHALLQRYGINIFCRIETITILSVSSSSINKHTYINTNIRLFVAPHCRPAHIVPMKTFIDLLYVIIYNNCRQAPVIIPVQVPRNMLYSLQFVSHIFPKVSKW